MTDNTTVTVEFQAIGGGTVNVVTPAGDLPSVVATADQCDKDAADELCSYLSDVSGRTITRRTTPADDDGMVIHVGEDTFVNTHAGTDIDNLYADGYIVRYKLVSGRDHLMLAGGYPQSSQWAIEQFLRDYCGVRWLFPDATYGEVVPSKSTISIKDTLDKTYEPDYVSRANGHMYYFNTAKTYLRGGPIGYTYGYGSHMINDIFTASDFSSHPEWFCELNGERFRGSGAQEGKDWQICTTNADTVTHAADFVKAYFAAHSDAPVCSIGQNDNAGWCECDTCASFKSSNGYSQSEVWWYWVNQVAANVAQTYPNKTVEAMSYAATSTPPGFDLEDNVAITKTITAPSSLTNAEDWTARCKSVNLYSYAFGYPFFGFRHYPEAMQDFLQWGHYDLGAVAHVTECGPIDWSADGVKYQYLQALQWDVNVDIDDLMDDFCDNSYGAGKTYMRNFWDRFEDVYERRGDDRRLVFYQWVGWHKEITNDEFVEYTSSDVTYLDNCISDAETATSGSSDAVKFRVARTAEAWDYYRTMINSQLDYYDSPPSTAVTSGADKTSARTTADAIATLRADRAEYLGKMQDYPGINLLAEKLSHTVGSSYWDCYEAITLFSNELTLIDELCTSITEYIVASESESAAETYWEAVSSASDLYEAAQIQLYMLVRSASSAPTTTPATTAPG